eukprot:2393272-Pleurochrysis_carterae.AAC.3
MHACPLLDQQQHRPEQQRAVYADCGWRDPGSFRPSWRTPEGCARQKLLPPRAQGAKRLSTQACWQPSLLSPYGRLAEILERFSVSYRSSMRRPLISRRCAAADREWQLPTASCKEHITCSSTRGFLLLPQSVATARAVGCGAQNARMPDTVMSCIQKSRAQNSGKQPMSIPEFRKIRKKEERMSIGLVIQPCFQIMGRKMISAFIFLHHPAIQQKRLTNQDEVVDSNHEQL